MLAPSSPPHMPECVRVMFASMTSLKKAASIVQRFACNQVSA